MVIKGVSHVPWNIEWEVGGSRWNLPLVHNRRDISGPSMWLDWESVWPCQYDYRVNHDVTKVLVMICNPIQDWVNVVHYHKGGTNLVLSSTAFVWQKDWNMCISRFSWYDLCVYVGFTMYCYWLIPSTHEPNRSNAKGLGTVAQMIDCSASERLLVMCPRARGNHTYYGMDP
jgi:hypothetical protein